MALILQLETATSTCSVALASDGKTISFKEVNERNAHASNITLFIDDVLKEAGKGMQDLDAIAVSMGPGSYTGLRIGVSTAKGLCYGLDIPLIAIDTLKAMTYGMVSARQDDGSYLYCPMIDARRMEVYSAVFDQNLTELLAVNAVIIDQTSFANLLTENKIVFFGDGAPKCEETLSKSENALFVPDFFNSAKDLSFLADRKFKADDFVDVAYFEPFYLKDFLATQPRKA
jgi:tRNA threonylcarbamoyladenosine biosynthesis protein TsaB